MRAHINQRRPVQLSCLDGSKWALSCFCLPLLDRILFGFPVAFSHLGWCWYHFFGIMIAAPSIVRLMCIRRLTTSNGVCDLVELWSFPTGPRVQVPLFPILPLVVNRFRPKVGKSRLDS